MIAKTLQDDATLCPLGAPFCPGLRVLRPGVEQQVDSGRCYTAARILQSEPSVLGCLATVQAVERVQGDPTFLALLNCIAIRRGYTIPTFCVIRLRHSHKLWFKRYLL